MFMHNQKKKVTDLNMNLEQLYDEKTLHSGYLPLVKDFRVSANRHGEIWNLCDKILESRSTDFKQDSHLAKYKHYFKRHPSTQERWLDYCQEHLEVWFQEYLDNLFEKTNSAVEQQCQDFDEETAEIVSAICGRLLEQLMYTESWFQSDKENNLSIETVDELIREDIAQENRNKEFDGELGIMIEYIVDMDGIYAHVREVMSSIPTLVNKHTPFFEYIKEQKEDVVSTYFLEEVGELMHQKLRKEARLGVAHILDQLNSWFATVSVNCKRLVKLANGYLNKEDRHSGQLVLDKKQVYLFKPTHAYHGAYFGGIELTDKQVNASFASCTFDGCEILKAHFTRSQFTSCTFSGKGYMYGCEFDDCKIKDVKITVPFDLCKWERCVLSNVSANNKASFVGNVWKSVTINSHSSFTAKFTSNKMVNVSAKSQTFRGCDFTGSFIINCDFAKSDLDKSTFENVEISNSAIDEQYLQTSDTIRPPVRTEPRTSVYVYKKNFSNQTFDGLDYSDGRFKDCSFDNCTFSKCCFSRCSLLADFDKCFFDSCEMTLLQGNASTFTSCTIDKCDLAGANLSTATFRDTKILNSSMEGICAEGLRFFNTTFDTIYATGWKNVTKVCEFNDCTIKDTTFIGSQMQCSSNTCEITNVNTDDCNFSFSHIA